MSNIENIKHKTTFKRIKTAMLNVIIFTFSQVGH